MAIQKRHQGTLGNLSDGGAPDLSFSNPEPAQEVKTAEPAQVVKEKEIQGATTAPAKKVGRPKGIKGAGPKRLNLIQGDTDKTLALQLPTKLIDGIRQYAEDHNLTIKELIGRTMMKKIGAEYLK
ncbi:MAG: hypothetical protein MJZ69_06895 [Bacteroidaceae bacterium]|nr:hypothetical protein [Bacteroidaceae bacterium]